MNKIIRCFMDFEFTSSGHRHYDLKNNGIELISIAGVFVDEDFNVLHKYYSLVRPSLNTELSDFCINLTGITQNDILSARPFAEVVDEFCDFTKTYSDCKLEYYTWGDFDSFALRKSIKINSYKGSFNALRKKIKNIQPEISNSIKYKGSLLKKHWGLQDIKCVYNMPISKSSHNALSDAYDLYLVYTSYKQKVPFNNKFLKQYNQKLKLDKDIQRQKHILVNQQLNEELFLSIETTNINNISKLNISEFKELAKNINLNKFSINGSVNFHKNTIHFDDNEKLPNTLFIPLNNIELNIDKCESYDNENKKTIFYIKLNFIINMNEINECVEFKIPINQGNRKFLKAFLKLILSNI